MVIAVFGPRDFSGRVAVDAVAWALKQHPAYPDIHVISGGQYGVDSAAKAAARELGLDFDEIKAKWYVYGNSAGPIRNAAMVRACDQGIAVTRGVRTKGTGNMIDQLKHAKKPVTIVVVHSQGCLIVDGL